MTKTAYMYLLQNKDSVKIGYRSVLPKSFLQYRIHPEIQIDTYLISDFKKLKVFIKSKLEKKDRQGQDNFLIAEKKLSAIKRFLKIKEFRSHPIYGY